MQVHIQYKDVPHSHRLDEHIESEILSDPFLQKEFFTSIKCFISKEVHKNHNCYTAKMLIHSKNHEDFVCHCEAGDPYSPWTTLIHKAKHHYDKLFK